MTRRRLSSPDRLTIWGVIKGCFLAVAIVIVPGILVVLALRA